MKIQSIDVNVKWYQASSSERELTAEMIEKSLEQIFGISTFDVNSLEDTVMISKEWFEKYENAYHLQEIRAGRMKMLCNCGRVNCPDMLNHCHGERDTKEEK